MSPQRILATTLLALTATVAVQAQVRERGAREARFERNSVKYRDTGKRHATAKAGDVTVQARILMNEDHTADLELTTGAFDDATARGNIDRIAIESRSLGAVEEHGLANDGSHTARLRVLGRGEAVTIQAAVSGIHGRKQDEVTLVETAKYRPDLEVAALAIPDTIVAGLPTVIDAIVREVNGDLGARANCALSVNGQEVDRARGIWVDARGTVSCSFRYAFLTEGPSEVKVSLVESSPADWDQDDMTMTAQVTVASNASPMPRWGSSAEERYEDHWDYERSSWGYRSYVEHKGWQNTTAFSATWPENLDFATLRVRYVETTGGQVIVDLNDLALERDDSAHTGSGGVPVQCMVGLTDQMTISVCQSPGDSTRPMWINPLFRRRAGDVTYYSKQWGRQTPDSTDGTWSQNDWGQTTEGQQVRFADDVTLEVEVADATHSYAENPRMPLTQTDRSWVEPYRCWDENWCGDAEMKGWVKYGSATSPGY
jgi:hypothetical protein